MMTFHPGSRVSVRLPAGVNPLAVARSANPHVMMWSAPPKEVAFALPEELVKRGFRLVPHGTGLALCYFGGTAVFVR